MKRIGLAAVALTLAACGGSGTTAANCMSFTDFTADAGAVIAFGGANGNAYVPRCAQVKVSEPITFNGDFSVHPLTQTSGAAGAIPHTTAGTTLTFDIATAGTYDYQCDVHHAGGMTGAIQVVP